MAEDILKRGNDLIEPFCSGCRDQSHAVRREDDDCHLLGAGYELSVGDKYWAIRENEVAGLVIPSPDGRTILADPIRLRPAEVIIIRTREVLRLPSNMKGRLSLRAKWAQKFLVFSGGVIDPSYEGPLFMPVGNVGNADVEIRFGDRMWVAEFVEVDRTDKPGAHVPMDLPPSCYPPPAGESADYHPRRLAARLHQLERDLAAHGERISTLQGEFSEARASVQTTENVVKALFGAIAAGAAAGLAGGAALAGIQQHQFTSQDIPWVVAFMVFVAIVIFVVSWVFSRRR